MKKAYKDYIDYVINNWDGQKCRIYLDLVQTWRRGSNELNVPDPYIYGKVLDKAISLIDSITCVNANKKDIIDKCLHRFNFSKMHDMMEGMNWTWGGVNNNHVPSVDELKLTAQEMVNSTYDYALEQKNDVYRMGGGFAVYVYYRDDIDRVSYIHLSFEPIDSNVEYVHYDNGNLNIF